MVYVLHGLIQKIHYQYSAPLQRLGASDSLQLCIKKKKLICRLILFMSGFVKIKLIKSKNIENMLAGKDICFNK